MTYQQACATALLNVLRAKQGNYLGVIVTADAKQRTKYRLILDNAAYDRLKEKAGEPPFTDDYGN